MNPEEIFEAAVTAIIGALVLLVLLRGDLPSGAIGLAEELIVWIFAAVVIIAVIGSVLE